MTIDEAIVHAREVAEKNYKQGFLCHANPNVDKLDGCIKCAKEHEQLAEWLEELKVYQQHEIICNKGYNAGYNKALNDFVNVCEKQLTTMFGQRYADMRDIKNIAEQLKAGGNNDY